MVSPMNGKSLKLYRVRTDINTGEHAKGQIVALTLDELEKNELYVKNCLESVDSVDSEWFLQSWRGESGRGTDRTGRASGW